MRTALTRLMLSAVIALSLFDPSTVMAEAPEPAVNAQRQLTQDAQKGLNLKVASKDYYFLVLEGQGMPVKKIILNGTNVLGGSVVSQSMPINITAELKSGRNDLEIDMVAHPSDSFTTIVQKRTEGPRKTEITRIVVGANENPGKVIHKASSFDIDSQVNTEPIADVSDSDKEQIVALVNDYHQILKEKNISKFRKLYQAALRRENKIFPEGARYFEKLLDREIALLKKPEIEIGAFESTGLVVEPDGDKIKVCRKGANKPLIESNEIEVESEPIIVEIEDKKEKGSNDDRSAKPTAKQRLVTTKLLFRKIDGGWHVALPQGV